MVAAEARLHRTVERMEGNEVETARTPSKVCLYEKIGQEP